MHTMGQGVAEGQKEEAHSLLPTDLMLGPEGHHKGVWVSVTRPGEAYIHMHTVGHGRPERCAFQMPLKRIHSQNNGLCYYTEGGMVIS